MLKICLRHGMVVDKVHDVFSVRQSKSSEKNVNFSTQKRKRAKKDFKKTSIIYSITLSMEKRWKMFVI